MRVHYVFVQGVDGWRDEVTAVIRRRQTRIKFKYQVGLLFHLSKHIIVDFSADTHLPFYLRGPKITSSEMKPGRVKFFHGYRVHPFDTWKTSDA